MLQKIWMSWWRNWKRVFNYNEQGVTLAPREAKEWYLDGKGRNPYWRKWETIGEVKLWRSTRYKHIGIVKRVTCQKTTTWSPTFRTLEYEHKLTELTWKALLEEERKNSSALKGNMEKIILGMKESESQKTVAYNTVTQIQLERDRYLVTWLGNNWLWVIPLRWTLLVKSWHKLKIQYQQCVIFMFKMLFPVLHFQRTYQFGLSHLF